MIERDSVGLPGHMAMATIRRATLRDIDACTALLISHRRRNEALAPLFWRAAPRASLFTQLRLFQLLTRRGTLVLTGWDDTHLVGMLVAAAVRVPPVYNPGKTAMIDDFCVSSDDLWPDVGGALLGAAREWLGERGYRQVLAVTAYRDAAKSALFDEAGLSLTSAWWTGAV